MKGLRLLAALIAISIAAPGAEAQVWKPKSRQHSPTAKTRKPTPKKMTRKTVTKKKPAVKKKKKKKKARARADDDDFTIIEEDFPDED